MSGVYQSETSMYSVKVKELSMYGISLRMMLMCALLLSVLSLTGCGLIVRSAAVIEDIEVPTVATIGEDAEQGWIDYLAGQDYELNERLCDLNRFLGEFEDMLPGFLARRIQVRSARVVSLQFVAQQGDFNSITELDSVITVDGTHYMFSSGVRPGGLGTRIRLRPKPMLNLADAINNNECVNAYLRISGTLPENPLRFDVVLNYRLRLGLRFF